MVSSVIPGSSSRGDILDAVRAEADARKPCFWDFSASANPMPPLLQPVIKTDLEPMFALSLHGSNESAEVPNAQRRSSWTANVNWDVSAQVGDIGGGGWLGITRRLQESPDSYRVIVTNSSKTSETEDPRFSKMDGIPTRKGDYVPSSRTRTSSLRPYSNRPWPLRSFFPRTAGGSS